VWVGRSVLSGWCDVPSRGAGGLLQHWGERRWVGSYHGIGVPSWIVLRGWSSVPVCCGSVRRCERKCRPRLQWSMPVRHKVVAEGGSSVTRTLDCSLLLFVAFHTHALTPIPCTRTHQQWRLLLSRGIHLTEATRVRECSGVLPPWLSHADRRPSGH